MINKIKINNKNGENISEINIKENEYGTLFKESSKNVKNIFHENKTLEIDIDSILKEDILQEIMDIRWEFGRLSGKWEENEFIFEEITEEEYKYITSKCKQHNFRYTIKGSLIREVCEEFEEEGLSVQEIEDVECNINNYRQFDALATDIEEQLIEYLKTQLI